MSAVRSKGSRIEKKLGSALWAAGVRYRKHYPVIGKPDFALPGYKIAIFCDSHFWHGYKWEERKHDHKINKNFWYKKIERNIERDKEVNYMLTAMGWKVIRFWEHEINEDVEIEWILYPPPSFPCILSEDYRFLFPLLTSLKEPY